MKVCIVVQSEAFLTSAGVRIRYERFREPLGRQHGAELTLITLDALQAMRRFDADAYIFVKTFSVTALLMMAHLCTLGKAVGQDLFDDYFSQSEDARLARFRLWLAAAAPFTRFAICTTDRMRTAIAPYLSGIPVTVVDDPSQPLDRQRLDGLLRSKLARLRRERRLRVVWFGIGDNPYFPVGLQDLLAWGDTLARLEASGWSVGLQILTNDRALDVAALTRLRRFPVAVDLKQWSEATEHEALLAADIAFLPVAAQRFSAAKSLNRAVTAIEHGCQVLTPAYPLYDRLDPLVYQNVDDLVRDLARGRLRLNPEALERHAGLMTALADCDGLTAAFHAAIVDPIGRLASPPPSPRLCLIHGSASLAADHKLVTKLRGLSIASPFQTARLNFDMRFVIEGDDLVLLVHDTLVKTIDGDFAIDRSVRPILDRKFVELTFSEAPAHPLPLEAARSRNPAAWLAAYPVLMRHMVESVARVLPDAAIITSENNVVLQAVRAAADRRGSTVPT